ncbi:hypothetical protein BCR37DRAFT_24215 [Protomyces lactucae-debilis]|uniref:HCP-like protein n=1 Tax=Protomyces lactucae-debilis TaxID=2754530 RepID=A0A1Y2FDC8_PROLT|nr:uncharacterized protein BCR37DRAFT_24215 [Protomyces lactucae-debilis]ORY81932.1 hypothetical protein BCR37DRAFT_24215 [Protomyces lactucae-debilis]
MHQTAKSMPSSPATYPQMPGRSPLDDLVFAARGTTKYTESDAMSTFTVAESFFSTDTRFSSDTTVAYKDYMGSQGPQEVYHEQALTQTSLHPKQFDAQSVRSFWVEPEPVHRYTTPDQARRPQRAIASRDSVSSIASDATVKPSPHQHALQQLEPNGYSNFHQPRDIPREQYIVHNPNSRTPSPNQPEGSMYGFLMKPHTRRSVSSGTGQPGMISPKQLMRALSKSGKSPRQAESLRHASDPAVTSHTPVSTSSGYSSRIPSDSKTHGVASPRTPGGSLRLDLNDSRPRSRLPRKDLMASLESLQLDGRRPSPSIEARKSHSANPGSTPASYAVAGGYASQEVESTRRPPMRARSTSRKSMKPGNRQVSLNDSPMASLPDNALSPDDHVDLGIEQHEKNMLPQSTHHFRKAAEAGDPVGCLLYGLALRHGWGCRADVDRSLVYLEQAAQAASDTVHASMRRSMMAGKNLGAELAVAMFEIGMSYRNGWGVAADKKRAVEYFELASAWGDADAMIVLGDLYLRGDGCKKDKRRAAQILRAAEAKGKRDVGNSWIYKSKYD